MPTTVPVVFRASPLPSNFKGTPQQFLDALVARLALESVDEIAFFASGSVEPTSNVGPWLKNGLTWYVWSNSTGGYIPQVIDFESLRYQVALESSPPDENKYVFWIVIDVDGKAQDIRYYSGGAWKSIFEDKFAQYSTTTDTNTAISTAIADAVNTYPFRGDSSGDQDVVLAAGPSTGDVDLDLSETYDPASVFAGSTFSAPVDGVYQITAKCHLELSAGSPTGNAIIFRLKRNGGVMGNEQVFYPDEGTDGRTMNLVTQVSLLKGDAIKANVQFTIASGSGTWRVVGNNTFLSGFRVA